MNNKQTIKPFVETCLDDMKAVDVTSIDVKDRTSVTDWMIICSGTSKRHVKSIAENLVKEAKHINMQPLGIEGLDVGEWVLVDLGDAVIHVMMPETRKFYSIEKLWSATITTRETNEA